MGQITVTNPVTSATIAVSKEPPALPQAQRALKQAVASAVRTLNDVGFAGDGREVTFSVDRATRLPVVKVVDKDTKEVLQQWPQEYVLQLAETYKNNQRDSG